MSPRPNISFYLKKIYIIPKNDALAFLKKDVSPEPINIFESCKKKYIRNGSRNPTTQSQVMKLKYDFF